MSRIKARPPMIVMRSIHDKDLEIKEHMSVRAFALGVARKQHYELLLDMTNMLILGGSSANHRKYAKDYAENTLIPVLSSIKQRYDFAGNLAVSEQELKVLQRLPDFSKTFWDRQPIEMYALCGRELKAYYAELAEKRRKEVENETVPQSDAAGA